VLRAPAEPWLAIEHLFGIGAPVAPPALALSAAIVGLEALTAAALIRMSDHRRIIATVYSLVAGGTALVAVAALAAAWPIAPTAGRHAIDFQILVRWIPAAVQLAIPVATLFLVHRTVVPLARARYARR
jgi:hypothetical protein